MNLNYKSEFLDKAVPDKWGKDTINAIALNFGFEDSQLNQVTSIALSSEGTSANCFITGATGLGKTNLINSVLTVLTQRYSPEQLELVILDLKAIEYIAFADAPHTTLVAHTRMANTVDDWLDNLLVVARERIAELGDLPHIGAYNKAISGDGKKPIPRILVVIDEIQTFSVFGSAALWEKFASLLDLGRRAGIHFLIAAQATYRLPTSFIDNEFELIVKLEKRGYARVQLLDMMWDFQIPYLPYSEMKSIIASMGRTDRAHIIED